jgi:hypothetical protein
VSSLAEDARSKITNETQSLISLILPSLRIRFLWFKLHKISKWRWHFDRKWHVTSWVAHVQQHIPALQCRWYYLFTSILWRSPSSCVSSNSFFQNSVRSAQPLRSIARPDKTMKKRTILNETKHCPPENLEEKPAKTRKQRVSSSSSSASASANPVTIIQSTETSPSSAPVPSDSMSKRPRITWAEDLRSKITNETQSLIDLILPSLKRDYPGLVLQITNAQDLHVALALPDSPVPPGIDKEASQIAFRDWIIAQAMTVPKVRINNQCPPNSHSLAFHHLNERDAHAIVYRKWQVISWVDHIQQHIPALEMPLVLWMDGSGRGRADIFQAGQVFK